MDINNKTGDDPIKDERNKWKHLDSNYETHYEQKVSKHAHRGDVASTTRLLGYTDAMMATCGTFLVIPIRHLQELETAKGEKVENEESLGEFMSGLRVELLMFFLGFLIVATIWESINIRAIAVKRMDDFLVILSILSMLVTTVLPFALALQGHFPRERLALVATTLFLFLIELLEIIIILYAFLSPSLLHIEMQSWPEDHVKSIRNAMLKKSLLNIVFIIAAGLFVLIDYRISWAMLSLLVLNPLLKKFYLYMRRKNSDGSSNSEHSEFYWFLSKGNIGKERVEAFTDAATAIIACVLILDITVEEFPRLDKVKDGGLWKEIKHMQHDLFTFVGAYLVVSLLWYVNHTILNLFHTINVVILYTQKIFLCFLSLIPLCSNIMKDFTFKGHVEEDKKLGMRIASIMMFLASSCNGFMLAWGFHKKEKVLHKWALRGRSKNSKRQHMYITMKTLNMPYWSFVAFIGSFANAHVAYYIFLSCYFCMILSFLLFKFVFVNHIGKKVSTRINQLSGNNRFNRNSKNRHNRSKSLRYRQTSVKGDSDNINSNGVNIVNDNRNSVNGNGVNDNNVSSGNDEVELLNTDGSNIEMHEVSIDVK